MEQGRAVGASGPARPERSACLPAPGNRFRLDQSDPSRSRSLFFLLLTALFPFAQLSSPFPLRMTQKENAYPWPYGRQTVRALLLTLPLPAWRVPAWRGETLQKAISKHFLCHCAPGVCGGAWSACLQPHPAKGCQPASEDLWA